MALKLLTKLAAKSKIAKAGIVVSKTKTGVLASTAAAKLGTTAIATSSTVKTGIIVGATVAATSTTLGTETLVNGVLAKTTAANIETLGYNDITMNFDSNIIFLTGVILFVILMASWIIERRRTKKRRAKIRQDYYEATNTIAYQETFGIGHEEKTKLINIIRLYIMEFMNKNVFDIQKTSHFIGYIQRDCIKFSQAFLVVDRFMSESQQSVFQSASNLKTLMKKLDSAEKSYKKGSLSDIDFQQRVENIILGIDDEESLLAESVKTAATFVAKVALSSLIGLDVL